MATSLIDNPRDLVSNKCIAYLILLITLMAVIVPFAPGMPSVGIDESWIFGLNQAVAQNLRFGKDIAFTFGPFASVYTRAYGPATDEMMIYGSILLAVCYWLAMVNLSRRSDWRWIIVFCIVLAAFPYNADAVFFLYPLLAAMVAIRVAEESPSLKKAHTQAIHGAISIFVIFLPLGLLPLTKGSLVFACVPMVMLSAFALATRRCWLFAFVSVVSPMAGLVFLWWIAGQRFTDLAGYFINLAHASGGYTSAMALPGRWTDYAWYAGGASCICYALFARTARTSSKLLLAVAVAAIGFLSFKAGFVRHDGHVMRAAATLLLIACVLPFGGANRTSLPVIIVTAVCALVIASHYSPVSISRPVSTAWDVYANAAEGLRVRLDDGEKLRDAYSAGIDKIRKTEQLPVLSGTTDIYPWELSLLIASGNRWNPRPVFQSYSAYSLPLEAQNARHLQGGAAPDNIFFRVGTIDGRLPSLEDGTSWPVLLSDYKPAGMSGEYILLKRDAEGRKTHDNYRMENDGVHRLGENVDLSQYGNKVLFASIDETPTFLGRIVRFLFKLPELQMRVRTSSGSVQNFRIVSGMVQSGFLVSPLVTSTSEFGLLYGGAEYLSGNRVTRIVVTTNAAGRWLWSRNYRMSLYSLAAPKDTDLAGVLHLGKPVVTSNLTAATASSPGVCQGSVDVLDGLNPGAGRVESIGRLLQVRGWLANSISGATVPRKVFVTLSLAGGERYYIPTNRTPRPDVGQYFHKPGLLDVGYAVTADLDTVPSGRYALGLAYDKGDTIYQCPQFNFAVDVHK